MMAPRAARRLGWLVAVGLGAFLVWHVVRWWRVDRCLDAGGRYDYAAGACQH